VAEAGAFEEVEEVEDKVERSTAEVRRDDGSNLNRSRLVAL